MDLLAFWYIQSEFLVGAISTRRFLCGIIFIRLEIKPTEKYTENFHYPLKYSLSNKLFFFNCKFFRLLIQNLFLIFCIKTYNHNWLG